MNDRDHDAEIKELIEGYEAEKDLDDWSDAIKAAERARRQAKRTWRGEEKQSC